ncbi:phosphoribosylglycinamide formyltransferase [Candidatus Bartonella washoeensis]|nr:phosphoribosylglycinamide formyltransferase [Bartonella washoeensis]
MKKQIVVFISGNGSNMVALAKASKQEGYPAEMSQLFVIILMLPESKKHVTIICLFHVVDRKDYPNKEAHNNLFHDFS